MSSLINLYLLNERRVKGCIEDESESISYTRTVQIVESSKDEEFQENLANDYGYQDYNYQIHCKLLCSNIFLEDLEKAIELFKDSL